MRDFKTIEAESGIFYAREEADEGLVQGLGIP